ncbi:MAG: hypothetical protein WCG47_33665 [Dermatophilaceae bacterium]
MAADLCIGMDAWQTHRIPDAVPGPTAQVAGATRKPAVVDVWWPGTDGSIENATKIEGESSWRRSRVGGDGTTTPAGALAALSRVENHLQVFWIAPDGAVNSAYWLEGAGGYTRSPVAPSGSANPQGGVAAVTRREDLMEVWWIGPAGSVEGAWWVLEDPKTWNRYQLAPAASATPSSRVAAVSRLLGHMEVFWTGPDSSAQAAFWYDAEPTWRAYELAPPGSVAGHGGIAAACRDADHMHVVWVGEVGTVETASWASGGAWVRGQVAREWSAKPAAQVAAVSRDPKHLDVWWTGADGTVSHSSLSGDGWHEQLFPTPSGQSDVGGIAAVSPFDEALHVWWVDAGGEVVGSRWFDEPIDVIVRYRGLICFGETDWDQGSDSDEPYMVISVLRPDGVTSTVRSQIYNDVDDGENRADLVELYRGPAYGIQLGMLLMEHDSGDANAVRGQVDAAVKTASAIVTAAVTAGGGPLAGLAVGAALGAAGPSIVDAVNDALDTGDDPLGTQTRFLSRRELTDLVSAVRQYVDDVEFTFQSSLFTGDGASYKACFDVVPA